jgi:alanyl-tRNA synthetase
MTSNEIRNKFLKYFEGQGHQIVPSSPVIPAGDPTLLYTNAGMNQFKDVFLGREKKSYKRAVSVQKCIRAGGKHNDLELVGKTSRHLTFFEMLGNFSFGDYFKEEAIQFAWHFLTDELGLEEDKLWVSVYREDEESERIWKKEIGISAGKIYKMGEKDNFWSMGDTGPCGPCSEIGMDQGAEFGCDRPDCDVGCDCDRYLELWNLVFMQYNRTESGDMELLPKPSVDTGLGLERIAAVLQGVPSNFDTDLLRPLIDRVEAMTGIEYGVGNETSFRIISDHVRALVFAITDGVVPSNEGRGYVLRRILRRASRHGRILDMHEPFLYKLVRNVIEIMGSSYPELSEGSEGVMKVIRGEEERFGQTLDQGLSIFENMVKELGEERVISGENAFLLYDTFGFPVDLTAAMAEEYGLIVDNEGFERMMIIQKERARGEKEDYDRRDIRELGISHVIFSGYDTLSGKGDVQRIELKGKAVDSAKSGEEVLIDLTSTPFYGESGGQLGDTGILKGKGVMVRISDTRTVSEGRIVHIGKIEEGTLRVGSKVEALVDKERRLGLMRSHTATHLLHYALRKVLGGHVKQAGSLVAQDRLRFDFNHYSPLSKSELSEIEEIVQGKILSDDPVSTLEMSFSDAKKRGALAFFGEKYGDQVRVVDIEEFSTELCGGTHVTRTGEIGMMLNLTESSISAGVRRIEVLVGIEAFRFCVQQRDSMEEIMSLLKVPRESLIDRVEELKGEVQALQRQIKEYSLSRARDELKIDPKDILQIEGIPLFVRKVDVPDINTLRRLADEVRDRFDSVVGVLGAVIQKKAMLIVTITKDLVDANDLDATKIIGEIAKIVEGGGGGKRDLAQAGGKKWKKMDEALESAVDIVKGFIGK